MEALLGKNLEDLSLEVKDLGLPSFTAKQIANWLYVKKVSDIDQMTNLSKKSRELLSSKYIIGRVRYSQKQISIDGTKKYLFPSDPHPGYESVMIPDEERATICVSSQLGCKMGCTFCMTARMGFYRNLSSAEIISQFLEIDESNQLTNAVFMGMGEPLDNYDNVLRVIEILTADWGFGWSPKRITLSTIGVIPKLKKYLDESKCHLAISVHNPFSNERAGLMSVEKAFPLEEIVDLIMQYDFTGQRRVSFEYIMFDRVNDTKKHADALIRLFRGLECRVNLIRFHKIPDSDLTPSPLPVIEAFKSRLNGAGLTTTIRASKGEDILAACGMLAGDSERVKG